MYVSIEVNKKTVMHVHMGWFVVLSVLAAVAIHRWNDSKEPAPVLEAVELADESDGESVPCVSNEDCTIEHPDAVCDVTSNNVGVCRVRGVLLVDSRFPNCDQVAGQQPDEPEELAQDEETDMCCVNDDPTLGMCCAYDDEDDNDDHHHDEESGNGSSDEQEDSGDCEDPDRCPA